MAVSSQRHVPVVVPRTKTDARWIEIRGQRILRIYCTGAVVFCDEMVARLVSSNRRGNLCLCHTIEFGLWRLLRDCRCGADCYMYCDVLVCNFCRPYKVTLTVSQLYTYES